jgi:hypothetical protein
VELYLHSPNTNSWRGAQLKHGDNFTLNRCHVNIIHPSVPRSPKVVRSLHDLKLELCKFFSLLPHAKARLIFLFLSCLKN